MVSTRSKGQSQSSDSAKGEAAAETGDKRSAPSNAGRSPKKAKKEVSAPAPVEEQGQKTIEETIQGEAVETTNEKVTEDEVEEKEAKKEENAGNATEPGNEKSKVDEQKPKEEEENGQDPKAGAQAERSTEIKGDNKPGAAPVQAASSDQEPRHGTLESGHVYFLYRPKVEKEDPESIDDVSKFHILLIPKSGAHSEGHYHRIIEVGKKKLPDPGAKHQVIWGLVGAVGDDKSTLKDSFGASTYETRTRGTRHQPASRPAARGHYILHSPQDELADSPDHDRQRDYKVVLAYEITTPTHEEFGNVQTELGIAEKGAVVIQVKDPDAQSRGNPRAAMIPREKRAQYPPNLLEIFRGRRFIPPNPISLLDYPGAELLIITSPHELKDSLGGEHGDGEKVEDDLESDAKAEEVDVDGALKELGLNKKEFEEEALEGSWA